MNLTQSVSLTPKGEEELQHRAYKLDMKKRNVLILVRQPRTVQYVLDRAVFDTRELLEEMVSLVKDGFLHLGGEAGAASGTSAAPPAAKPAPASSSATPNGERLAIREDIILSEARFLMVDFCVEVFKTHSPKYVEKLGACKHVGAFAECVREIAEVTSAAYPDRLATLQAVIVEINQSVL